MINKNNLLNQWVGLLIASSFFSFSATPAHATPQSSYVVAGIVTIQKTGHHIEIIQKSDKAIVEWKNFNIGAHDSVHIQQPKGGAMLIRVDSNNRNTHIDGKLLATGQVILVNQAGVAIANTGNVQIGM